MNNDMTQEQETDINKIIKDVLPIPAEYPDDIYVHKTISIDMRGDVRPTHGTYVDLIFVKNEAKDAWLFDGRGPMQGE